MGETMSGRVAEKTGRSETEALGEKLTGYNAAIIAKRLAQQAELNRGLEQLMLQQGYSPVEEDPVLYDWRDDALCAEIDPELFFPEKGGSATEPKTVCEKCIVKDDCLEYALEHDERFGIWGGKTQRERAAIKASRKRQARALAARQAAAEAEKAKKTEASATTAAA